MPRIASGTLWALNKYLLNGRKEEREGGTEWGREERKEKMQERNELAFQRETQ